MQGRSQTDEKVRVVIALEVRDGKVGNAYAQVIGDFSTKSPRSIFDRHISRDARVRADGWGGYSPLRRTYKRLIQEYSKKGANFPEIHIQIRYLKNWLRGVHSYCHRENVQDYPDEYFYRFNRRGHRKSTIDRVLQRFVASKSPTRNEIRTFTT